MIVRCCPFVARYVVLRCLFGHHVCLCRCYCCYVTLYYVMLFPFVAVFVVDFVSFVTVTLLLLLFTGNYDVVVH